MDFFNKEMEKLSAQLLVSRDARNRGTKLQFGFVSFHFGVAFIDVGHCIKKGIQIIIFTVTFSLGFRPVQSERDTVGFFCVS